MPCHSTQTAQHFSTLTPLKHSLSIQELLGHADAENPATFGIFSFEKGHPANFDKLPFHCFATITEGEAIFEDLDNPGNVTHVKAGDIMHVPTGTSIRGSTPTSCKGTYVQLKPLGDDTFHKGVY